MPPIPQAAVLPRRNQGISRENARLEEWLKDIAPSPELRKWFCHKDESFAQFSRLYRAELATDAVKQAAVRRLLEMAKAGNLTLVYGAKSDTVNQAVVLREYLLERAGEA